MSTRVPANFGLDLHTFRSSNFQSIVRESLHFFEHTPIHRLPVPERFIGAGVYALYYVGGFDLYEPIAIRNRETVTMPIYVGKAVPPGSRTGLTVSTVTSANLFGRLREHRSSITQAENLNIEDFRCRFMVVELSEIDLIALVESALIRKHKPLWNANVLSGFGIHTPGEGRFEQRRSKWDVLHPGRPWASRMANVAGTVEDIRASVMTFLSQGFRNSTTAS